MTRSMLGAAAVLAAALVVGADAATTVAVMELGKGGVAHAIPSQSSRTTVSGVASFWNAMHTVIPKSNSGRRPAKAPRRQDSGMNLVPDLFSSPKGGLVVGILLNTEDADAMLTSMPTISKLLSSNDDSITGHFDLEGDQGMKLLNKASAKNVLHHDVASFGSALKTSSNSKNQLEAVALVLKDEAGAAEADAQVANLIKSLKEASDGKDTFVLHVVVQHQGSSRRQLEDQDQNENDDQGNDNGYSSGYYSAGYYNSDDVWVSTYRTIFQIQYFNVVLWTSIGLSVVLMYATYLMLYMPLMTDTLLFGESAKMVSE
jgi:hypothetical protein|uniref:Uncharacterized protein n=1 Tax=Attheya septentrionalis TaxID=420275 RepID=A0A6T7GVH7_9STRA|mmetsp:Transcript_18173/g.32954  ORF Transcript_18173/g.32954 Transcript_18173/m.32954 type:complete len:316 (+) Transcript_18173:95-1042(+)|eukprot:CAMPEP_0198293412 /NCGR_PEP_ID=MMETSP1449-20131203/17067_1 /TAXON_ID=420275 /ORGANISM="Attheya septentrionalis, Strain CCMP2084" /LENGTH=315 /DNA_ID=CAMNT_0043992977 /DNA_START=36 /DNA_END=983 /DNA_ORIENTATION=+